MNIIFKYCIFALLTFIMSNKAITQEELVNLNSIYERFINVYNEPDNTEHLKVFKSTIDKISELCADYITDNLTERELNVMLLVSEGFPSKGNYILLYTK